MMHGSGNLIRGGGNVLRGGGSVMRGVGPGYMANGHTGWLGMLPLAFHLFFMVIIIVLAVICWKRHSKKVRAIQKQNDPALLVLRQRYAQGEIDTEEFNRRKQDLSN
ncbi:MAG: SHOCT domain-containing protein [Desulfosporosinus sp.]|nr:SHOCT domain-containing protein [Desulfosporosinus sp.]